MDFLLTIAPSGETRRGNFVSGRDGLIYIKGTIAPRGLIRPYGARYVFYNRIGYVAGRPDRSRAVCDFCLDFKSLHLLERFAD
jgi:hypothetical protein